MLRKIDLDYNWCSIGLAANRLANRPIRGWVRTQPARSRHHSRSLRASSPTGGRSRMAAQPPHQAGTMRDRLLRAGRELLLDDGLQIVKRGLVVQSIVERVPTTKTTFE